MTARNKLQTGKKHGKVKTRQYYELTSLSYTVVNMHKHACLALTKTKVFYKAAFLVHMRPT